MKKRIGLFISFLVIFSSGQIFAQQWLDPIPEDKLNAGDASFYDIQKAFNDYWGPKNVEGGYYMKDGERVKAGGWKQFKRWEWFWESRVDVETGAFPASSSFYEFQKYREEHPGFKGGSLSGNWTALGPVSSDGGYSGIGRLNCVAFHPNDNNIIYVGAAAGGIWKSTDGGNSWMTLSDNNAVLGVSDIVVLENGGTETIYIATGDRDAADNFSVGVLKSTDGGISWNTTGLNWGQNYGRTISRLQVNPDNTDILYVSTSIGLYKTTNAGLTWTMIHSANFADIELKPGNPDVIYASTRYGGEVYLSTDAGASFSLSLDTGAKRAQLAVSQDDPGVVYSLICNSYNGLHGVYKSNDSGASFTEVHGSSPNMLDWYCAGTGSGGQGWYDLCIAVDPTDANRVFIGGVNTWGSSDGGSTWDIKNVWSGTCSGDAQEVHADKHFLAFQNGSSILFECNDGGLYKSTNSGTSWIDLSDGLEISQLYRLGVSQTHSQDVIGGLQDNGTKSYYSGTWDDVIGGDGMDCAINPVNNDIQYGELYNGEIRRTTNHWASSYTISNEIPGSGAWVTPYVLDPNNPDVILVGYTDVWRRDFNAGSNWVNISKLGLTSTLRAMAVAPSNSDVICAATLSVIYRTTNGGSSWTSIPRPANNSITWISIDSNDPDHFWVAFGQFSSNCVYETSDGGNSWTDISQGLPSIPTNCVIQNVQNTSETELYAATDVGVYLKIGNNEWVPFMEGLPNVVVTELEIYYDSNPANSKLRAATYGRGLWESDLYEGSSINPVVFNTDPIITANASEDNQYNRTLDEYVDYSGSETLAFSKQSGPTWLIVDPANGSLSGIPENSDVGLNTFVVRVSAGTDGSDDAELKITVDNTNDSPVFNVDPISGTDATEGIAYSGSIASFASDDDGDNLSFAKIDGPAWLKIESNGAISGTPGITDHDLNLWTVEVSDGNGGTDGAVLQIYVWPVNHPPVFISDPFSTGNAYEDAVFSGSISEKASDPDSDELTFRKVSGPLWLAVALDGALSGTPAQDNVGINSFVVEANDNKGGVVEATMEIDVLNTNDPPVFASSLIVKPDIDMEVPFNGSIAGEASDEDGDIISYSKISGPAWLVIGSDGSLSGTPQSGDVGVNTWTIQASDATENADAQLQIEVLFVNTPPEFKSDPFSADNATEDLVYSSSIAGSASDYDTHALSYSKLSGPSWLSVAASGDLSGLPVQSDAGMNVFTVMVDDGNGGSDQATLNIEVLNVNDAPVFNTSIITRPDAFIGQEYFGTISGEASDEDGDALSYRATEPSWLTVAPDGSLYGTPSAINEGLNSWTIEVDDGHFGTASSTLEIYVKQPSSYCSPAGWDPSAEWIETVSFNGVPYNSGQGNGYNGLLPYTFQFEANTTLSYALVPGYSGRADFVYWNVWIDYNKDGDFNDSGELVISSPKKKNTFEGSFNIGGEPGLTRMRVSVSDISGALPCADNRNGEVEDYTIEIVMAGPKPPVAQFSANPTSGNPGLSVVFTDESLNEPTSWSWDLGNGQTSNLKNPTAVYNTVGKYVVSLTVTNGEGTDAITKVDYIDVSEETVGSYCEPVSIDNSADWINAIIIEGITNNSGQGASGYEDFTSIIYSMAIGNTVPVSLSPFNDKNRNFWRIWIDLNADSDFDDADETLLVGNNKKGLFNSSITIPATATPGQTRMRIAMQTGSSVAQCDDNYPGEVEDYTVDLIAGTIMRPGDDGPELNSSDLNLNLFPNPVNDILTVQITGSFDHARLKVFNLVGQQLEWLPVKSDYTDIDVSNLEKGLYFLVYESEGMRIVNKFVKD